MSYLNEINIKIKAFLEMAPPKAKCYYIPSQT